MPIRITDPSDPALTDYVGLTDMALRRALAAGHRPRSYLMGERWLTDLADLVADAEAQGIPVYTGDKETIESLTGFNLHRGAIASMHRPPLPALEQVLDGARRVAILEDVVDHTNVGAQHHMSRRNSLWPTGCERAASSRRPICSQPAGWSSDWGGSQSEV